MGSLVSGIGDLFGGAPNNANFSAVPAPLIQPVTAGQVNQAQGTAISGVNQAQNLASTLAPGVSQGMNTQNMLTQALLNQANGVGPNPAQAALAQNTGTNVANQAALMAGQRGVGQNAGLLAREVGQQGAGIQQNAVGQAATLQAQQQLAAQQQLQQLAQQQTNQGLAGAGLFNQAALGNQGQLLNALQGYNQAQVGSTTSQNSANAGIAQTNANNTSKAIGGLFGGLSSGGGGAAMMGAEGGEVPEKAKQILAKALSKKEMPDHMLEIAKIYHPKVMKMAMGGECYDEGGNVTDGVDPNAIRPIATDSSSSSNSGGQMKEAMSIATLLAANEGAVVPGKPKVEGKNTLKNDVVPAMLTPKEIVLPLSVTQSKNPGEAAKAFVEKIKGKDNFKEALKAHMKNRKSK